MINLDGYVEKELSSDLKELCKKINDETTKLCSDILSNRNNLIEKCLMIFGIDELTSHKYTLDHQWPKIPSICTGFASIETIQIDLGIVELTKNSTGEFIFGIDGFNNIYTDEPKIIQNRNRMYMKKKKGIN